jgi:GNAT superfamily N-acetyltransferase
MTSAIPAPSVSSGGRNVHPLDNPVWHALTTHHAYLAERQGSALRYPSDVSVFSAVDRFEGHAWSDLGALVGPGGIVVLARPEVPPPAAGWREQMRLRGHQMTVTDVRLGSPAAAGAPRPRLLTSAEVPAMLDLIALTRPGPFEARTIEMGRYFGIFVDDGLVAMAGERLHFEGFTEVSAVCTHPESQGKGLGAALTHHVASGILDRGETPFLHVVEENHIARRVYEHMGFTTRLMVEFVALQSPPAPVPSPSPIAPA